MLNLLSSLVNTVVSLVNFFINTIQSLILLITQIPTYIAYIVSSFSFLPNMLLPFVTASLFLLVVLFLIDR